MNDVRDVELALTSFPHLEVKTKIQLWHSYDQVLSVQVLDLSYNQLSSTALVKLGALPRLRELNLSGLHSFFAEKQLIYTCVGNELSSLPAEMSRMGQEYEYDAWLVS